MPVAAKPPGTPSVSASSPPLADRAAVVGRLARFVPVWRHSGADPLTLSWLVHGVPILFDADPRVPPPRPNIISAADQLDFIRREVSTMLQLGAISRVPTRPLAVWQLMTAPKAGPRRFRLVVNMKPLTKSVHSPTFKLERLEEFLLLLRPGALIWTRDLRDGYFHVPMAPSARPWLGFALDGKFYVYNVLPFGLRSAPFIFTKLMRTPLRVLRSRGVEGIAYIDDIVCTGSPSEAADKAATTDQVLDQHGLVVADDKKQGPAHRAQVLGMVVDTVLNRLSLPNDKLHKTMAMLQAVLTVAARPSHRVPAHVVAQLLGKLQWFARAAPAVRLFSRSLQFDLRSRLSWYHRIVLQPQTRKDLAHILRHAVQWNQVGAPIWRDAPSAQVFTDASTTGWGAALYIQGRFVRSVAGVWDSRWLPLHINAKELQAVLLAIQAFRASLLGTTVEFRIDNTTAVSYLRNAGGYFPHLVAIARQVWLHLLAVDATPSFMHLRGVLNVVADALSRGRFVTVLSQQYGQVDPDDWQLHPALFRHIDRSWGPHTVDRFARSRTRQCARFWSRVLEPGCEGVNAFTADWSGENNFVNPPFGSLLLVLRHLLRCRAQATVIVPHWPAQPWWPLLTKLATAWMPLPESRTICLGSYAEPLRNPSWRLLAVRVDGSRLV